MVRRTEPTPTWLGLIRRSEEEIGTALIRLAELAALEHERELERSGREGGSAGKADDPPGPSERAAPADRSPSAQPDPPFDQAAALRMEAAR